MKTLKAKVVFVNDYEKQRKTEKEYHYLTLIEDLKEEDLVVVETRHGYAVAEFAGYIDDLAVNSSAYIVQKVDVTGLNAEKDRQNKIARLKQEIDQKAKEALQRKKLNELAEEDADLKVLLDTLDSLEA